VSNSFWEQIATANGEALRSLAEESRSVVVLSVRGELDAEPASLLDESVRVLRTGGILCLYGAPHDLPSWGERLLHAPGERWRMVFKYWIALAMDDSPRAGFLKPVHRGLVMFQKRDARKKTAPALPLHPAEAKVPHQFCAACGLNIKDWGGKKHHMNPKGTALSDVWRDLPQVRLKSPLAPETVLERIRRLTEGGGGCGLHVVQPASAKLERRPAARGAWEAAFQSAAPAPKAPMPVPDQVHLGDCIPFLERVAQAHPEGVFDLAFADPPYNLA
jgi:site-specific DNA-methyltransferase (adenine-specific)